MVRIGHADLIFRKLLLVAGSMQCTLPTSRNYMYSLEPGLKYIICIIMFGNRQTFGLEIARVL